MRVRFRTPRSIYVYVNDEMRRRLAGCIGVPCDADLRERIADEMCAVLAHFRPEAFGNRSAITYDHDASTPDQLVFHFN